jgi:biopolymer transport protein ExbD
MSGAVDSGGPKGKGGSPDFDLNLAPIIDCFTVLITFMLASASFISIGVLDAGAGSGAAPSENKDQKQLVAVQVDLQPQFTIQVKMTGKVTSTIPVPSKDGTWDFETLVGQLKKIKTDWPQTDSITLTMADDMEHKYLMASLENVKKVFPGVLLGGF